MQESLWVRPRCLYATQADGPHEKERIERPLAGALGTLLLGVLLLGALLILTAVSCGGTTQTSAATDDSLQKVLDAGELILGFDSGFPLMGFINDDTFAEHHTRFSSAATDRSYVSCMLQS